MALLSNTELLLKCINMIDYNLCNQSLSEICEKRFRRHALNAFIANFKTIEMQQALTSKMRENQQMFEVKKTFRD